MQSNPFPDLVLGQLFCLTALFGAPFETNPFLVLARSQLFASSHKSILQTLLNLHPHVIHVVLSHSRHPSHHGLDTWNESTHHTPTRCFLVKLVRLFCHGDSATSGSLEAVASHTILCSSNWSCFCSSLSCSVQHSSHLDVLANFACVPVLSVANDAMSATGAALPMRKKRLGCTVLSHVLLRLVVGPCMFDEHCSGKHFRWNYNRNHHQLKNSSQDLVYDRFFFACQVLVLVLDTSALVTLSDCYQAPSSSCGSCSSAAEAARTPGVELFHNGVQ